MKRIVLFTIFVFHASMALATADEARRVRFLGFSEDGRFALIDVNDPNSGNRLEVYGAFTGLLKVRKFYNTPVEMVKIRKSLTRKYKIKDQGNSSFQDPTGRYSFTGVQQGKYFKVLVMRGNKKAVLKRFKNSKAIMTLKEVWWSSDGRTVLLVVNKKKRSEDYGMDVDIVKVLRFHPKTLRFK